MGPSGLTVAACGIVFHRGPPSALEGVRDVYDGRTEPPVSDGGYLVGVSLGQDAEYQVPGEARVSIRKFEDPFRADFPAPMDFLLMEIPQSSMLHAIARSSGIGGTGGTRGMRGLRRIQARSLECVSSVKDPVIASLARAVVSVLERPAQASRLFLDQMGVAITTYLLEKYGGPAAAPAKAATTLPRHIEAKAKDMLRSRLDGSVSIAAIADACALSRSYFSRAFRETTGSTPHQWLTGQRLDAARGMLKRDATPLADIAAACGFADQSHFTRVFTAAEGMSPGVWRKRMA